MSNVLGFPIGNGAGGGGEFTPIVKYDARAGRIFRVDRVQSADGFDSVPVDITASFKAIFDLDNIQTGWMLFTPGAAPAFVLVPLADVEAGKLAYPAQPGDKYKSGVRFMMKLNKNCGGESQIREIAGQSSAFLSSIAALYEEWKAAKAKHPGQLPVVSLVSTTPVKSGSGVQSSTNYHPKWRIDGYAQRPDDLKATVPPLSAPKVEPLPLAPPATGAHTVPPPNVLREVVQVSDDDFG